MHIATIAKAHVNFVPEKMSLVISGSNRILMVGQKVRMKLINVNADRGHIDFELAEEKSSDGIEKSLQKIRDERAKSDAPPRSSRRPKPSRGRRVR